MIKTPNQFLFLLIPIFCSAILLGKYFNKKDSHLISKKSEILAAFEYQNSIYDFPYDNNELPLFYRSYLQSKAIPKALSVSRSKDNWTSIGPDNIGGRSLAIALNPLDTSELWMGSASGGLWHSKTGGLGQNAWTYVPTGFPVLGVHAIAIDPGNPDNIYIGTGEIYNYGGSNGGIFERTLRGSWGIGILKSTDHGKSWQLSLDWTKLQHQGIFEIIIDPKNSSIVYAASTHGIWKTIDSGKHWNQITDLPMVTDLHLDPAGSKILYAGVGGLNAKIYGLFKSIDAGISWNRISSPFDSNFQGRIMINAYKKNPARIYVAYADKFRSLGFIRTRDHFQTTKFSTPIPDICQYQGWYAKCLYVKDNDSSKILLGGVDLYYDTSGTGNQFMNLILSGTRIHADMHDIISNPHDPQKIYIATDGGLFRSFNFGNRFVSCNSGYHTSQFYNATCDVNGRNRILGGLQDNRSCLYEGNNNWRSVSQGDGCFNAFHPDSNHVMYTSIQYGVLFKTINQAGAYTQITAGDPKAAFVAPFEMHQKSAEHLYVGTTNLLHTQNGGKTWKQYTGPFNDGIITVLKSSPTQINDIMLSIIDRQANKIYLFQSNNFGSSVNLIGANLPNKYLRKILWNGQDSILLAYGGYNTQHLYQSIDGGLSFQAIGNNLPDYPLHTIAIDPNDNSIIYAGSDLGLFVSEDAGNTFKSYNHHEFDIMQVYDLKHNSFYNKLAVFTHGLGAFLVSYLKKTTNSENTKTQNTLPNIINSSQVEKWMIAHNIEKIYSIQGTVLENNNMTNKKIPAGIYFAAGKKIIRKIYITD